MVHDTVITSLDNVTVGLDGVAGTVTVVDAGETKEYPATFCAATTNVYGEPFPRLVKVVVSTFCVTVFVANHPSIFIIV